MSPGPCSAKPIPGSASPLARQLLPLLPTAGAEPSLKPGLFVIGMGFAMFSLNERFSDSDMPTIDDALGIHPQAVRIRAARAEILAANIANADTPYYQARDMDFQAALRGAESGLALNTTSSGHIGLGTAGMGNIELLYRQPTQPSLDQNTVEVDQERARFIDNAMRYQASLRFLDGRFSGLISAFRGE